MQVAPVGHLGPDEYGQYIKDVLQREGVHEVRPLIGGEHLDDSLKQTLLCFVLVAPDSAHSFCSRYDFGPWPLLPGVTTMPPPAWQALQDTQAVYLNGCLFDELPSDMVLSVLLQAKSNGAVICFDPGPRSWVLSSGSRRPTLDALLDLSDIVVMTEEEALAVTGQTGAQAAAQWVLNRPKSSTQWSIVKQGSSGSVLCSRQSPAVYNQSALQVPVGDTVGCGDSFAAAIVLGYIRGYDIPATMALANAVGAATAMGTGAGSQNQYQPQPHANSIPPPVHTQQALPTPQSYRMVQQGSHSRPQAQAQSPHGAQHQFQVLPNLSSESLRGPSLSQPQGLTAEHCSTLALSPGDHPLQVSPAQQQAHPPGASPSPRYDEAVLTTPAHSQDSVPMHQNYGAGPSQPQGSADHFCQQPQAHHQASEGIRHRSPSLEPIPLLDAPPPQSVAPEGSNMLQPASVPPRIAQYHNQTYVQLNPQLQAPQAHQNQQLYPPSSYHTPAAYPPQGSIQGGPAYAPGLMTADYSGGNSAGVSDEALGPGKKRKKEKARLPTAYNLFVREEITRLKAQNPTMSHKEAFGIAADHVSCMH
ncbi:hypothetical protein WJX79_004388 [Trebouxia sp. C0005]